MNLPKQAAPVQRILAPTAISSEQGVDPSLSMEDLDEFVKGLRKGNEIVKEGLLNPFKSTMEAFGPLFGLLG